MVDSISNANSVRKVGQGVVRHRSPSGIISAASDSKTVEQIAASGDATERDPDEDKPQSRNPGNGLNLEVSEDGEGNELVYRFVNPSTGKVVGEWNAEQIGKLRDYLRAKNLHLFDKTI